MNSPRPPIDLLEDSLRGISSVTEWLESPGHIEAYRTELGKFYQLENFPPKSFGALLSQLRAVVSQNPAIGERLWETTQLGQPVWVAGHLKNFQRELDYPNWLKYHGEWLNSLQTAGRRANRAATLDFIREQSVQFVKSLATCANQEEERERRSKFYLRMQNDPQNKALAGDLLCQFLSLEKIQTILLHRDADVVLSFLALLDTQAANFIPHEDTPVLLTVIRRLIPKTAWLLRQTSLFAYASKNETQQSPTTRHPFLNYEFRPLSRRFHGVWKGGSVSDCVGGALSFEDSTTPQRWGLCAIRESQTFHVFQHYVEGDNAIPSYKGFVQIVPVLHKVTGKKWGGVDFFSPVADNRILLRHSRDLQITSLYEGWLQEWEKQKPAGWQGLAVGDSWTFNNYKTLDLIYDTPSFILGQRQLVNAFKGNDPIVERALVTSVPRTNIARHFRSTLISEGTAFGTRVLTLLKPVLNYDEARHTLLQQLQQPDWASDIDRYWHAAITLLAFEPENELVFQALKNLLPLASQNRRQRVYENLIYGSYRLFSAYVTGLTLQRRYLVFWVPTIERLGAYLLDQEKRKGSLPPTEENQFYLKQLRKVAVVGRTYQVRLYATRILTKIQTLRAENLRSIQRNTWMRTPFSGHFGRELHRLSCEAVNASANDKSDTNRLPIAKSHP